MDYYTVSHLAVADGHITAQIKIDAAHDIFRGHFPDMPILPGVCQVQIITKVLAQAVEQTLSLHKADNIKFLAMMDPSRDPEIALEINIKSQTDDEIGATATMSNAGNTIIKFSGRFEKVKKYNWEQSSFAYNWIGL